MIQTEIAHITAKKPAMLAIFAARLLNGTFKTNLYGLSSCQILYCLKNFQKLKRLNIYSIMLINDITAQTVIAALLMQDINSVKTAVTMEPIKSENAANR